jgi:hypothetical protein
MQQTVFHQSLNALKTTSRSNLPPADLQAHARNVAEGFIGAFSRFAVETCGCEKPDDRVQLRKAVWHQTVGMRLIEFQKRFQNEPLIRTMGSMECPVQILGKNFTGPHDESCPSKIIMASKQLRAHVDVSEATTCRGCSKRGRCPFVRKVIPNNRGKTSLGALTKVLFGLSQSCRLHLKNPEQHPFVVAVPEVEASLKLIDQLRRFLEPSAVERQLRNVPLADRKAVKAIVARQMKKNEELKEKRAHARRLGIPDELVDSEQGKAKEPKRSPKTPKFDINSSEWIPEEKSDEFSETNIQFRGSKDSPTESSKNFVQADGIERLPIPERYPQGRKLVKTQSKTEKRTTFDISSVNSKTREGSDGIQGGYVVGEPPKVSSQGIEYIKPDLMRGKTVTDNVSMAAKVWGNMNPHISELKFLKRVPFQAGVPMSPKATDATLSKVLSSVNQRPRHIGKSKENLDAVKEISSVSPHADTNESSSGRLEFPKLPSWDPSTVGKINVGQKTEKVRLGPNGIVSERLRTDFSKLMRPPKVSDNIAQRPASKLDVVKETRRAAKASKN